MKIETPATVPETLPHKEIVPMLPPGLKKELKTEIKTDVGNRHSPELKPVLVRYETPVKISSSTTGTKVKKFYQSVKHKLELVNEDQHCSERK